jgi:hypothetical protein
MLALAVSICYACFGSVNEMLTRLVTRSRATCGRNPTAAIVMVHPRTPLSLLLVLPMIQRALIPRRALVVVLLVLLEL